MRGERGGILAMIGVMLVWGINVSVMKAALAEVPPQVFNGLRFPLGMITLSLVLFRLEPRPWPTRAEWPVVARLGVIAHPLYQLCFLNGLALTSASHTTVIVAITPVWVALADHFLGHERLPARAWAGILLSLAGVLALVLARGGSAAHSSLLGDFLVLLGGMLWTWYVIGSREILRTRSALWVTGWALIVGAPLLLLLGLPQMMSTDWGRTTWVTWGGVLYAGLLAVALAYTGWALGLQRLGASRTAAFSNLNPVFGLLTAWIWLGERLALLAWVGAAVVLLGVWLTSTSRRAAAAAVQPD